MDTYSPKLHIMVPIVVLLKATLILNIAFQVATVTLTMEFPGGLLSKAFFFTCSRDKEKKF